MEKEQILENSLLREKEIREMDSRELLHRYDNVCGYRCLANWRGYYEELPKIEKERWEYESELLKRLSERPNDIQSVS